MKNNNLFEIKNLTCSYKNGKGKGKTVLKINELKIPRGKIIFLLGFSGSGKSTLLETLGLMNETIDDGSEVMFYSNNNKNPKNFAKLWSKSQKDNIYKIRNEHFSFIFQNTNLMPNFTALENIYITRMLQGKDEYDSREHAEPLLDAVGMEKLYKKDEKKKASELSGGEKQRVAFVRAIVPKFTVLFGDEPTGNLDDDNSEKLMSVLKNNIKKDNRSAIIVSHNIESALKFGDQLIILSKGKDDPYGIINKKNIFSKINGEQNVWLDDKNKQIEDIRNVIKKAMLNQKI